MGLDLPIIVQYVRYILDVVRLNFGSSWVTGYDVLESFMQRLRIRSCWPSSLRYGLSALGIR